MWANVAMSEGWPLVCLQSVCVPCVQMCTVWVDACLQIDSELRSEYLQYTSLSIDPWGLWAWLNSNSHNGGNKPAAPEPWHRYWWDEGGAVWSKIGVLAISETSAFESQWKNGLMGKGCWGGVQGGGGEWRREEVGAWPKGRPQMKQFALHITDGRMNRKTCTETFLIKIWWRLSTTAIPNTRPRNLNWIQTKQIKLLDDPIQTYVRTKGQSSFKTPMKPLCGRLGQNHTWVSAHRRRLGA